MNKNILKIHEEVLDSKRLSLLKKTVPYSSGYILGGGTALALQLAHRKSFDFDFFSSFQIPRDFLEKISKDIAIKKAYTIGRRGEYRDYFDLYTILKLSYINLQALISGTKKNLRKCF